MRSKINKVVMKRTLTQLTLYCLDSRSLLLGRLEFFCLIST